MKHAPEESFGGHLVPPFLQQDVEFGTLLIDRAP
jgi:hypothetical protein